MAIQSGKLYCRYIRNEAGKHSFQVVSSATEEVIYAAPDWYNTKEEAADVWRDGLTRTRKDFESHGGKVISATDYAVEFEVECGEETVDICIGAIKSPKTGKFGVACLDGDKVLIQPTQWFNTLKEAEAFYDTHRDELVAQVSQFGEVLGVSPTERAKERQKQKDAQFKLPGAKNLPKGFDCTIN